MPYYSRQQPAAASGRRRLAKRGSAGEAAGQYRRGLAALAVACQQSAVRTKLKREAAAAVGK